MHVCYGRFIEACCYLNTSWEVHVVGHRILILSQACDRKAQLSMEESDVEFSLFCTHTYPCTLHDACRQKEAAGQEALVGRLQNTVEQLEQTNRAQEQVGIQFPDQCSISSHTGKK